MGSICSPHGCMAVPPQGTGADPDEVLYDLLEVRIIGLEMPAQRRMFCSPDMLIMSISGANLGGMEVAMPVVETVGPLTGRPSAPPPAKRTALDKFGALPVPSLEWNAEIERDTAHLYERVKN